MNLNSGSGSNSSGASGGSSGSNGMNNSIAATLQQQQQQQQQKQQQLQQQALYAQRHQQQLYAQQIPHFLPLSNQQQQQQPQQPQQQQPQQQQPQQAQQQIRFRVAPTTAQHQHFLQQQKQLQQQQKHRQQQQQLLQQQKKGSAPVTEEGQVAAMAEEGGHGKINSHFQSLFEKYREAKQQQGDEVEQRNTAPVSGADLMEKMEFMFQIASLQAAKIRRLEDRVYQLEAMLPDATEFAMDDPVDGLGQTVGGQFHPKSTWNTSTAQDLIAGEATKRPQSEHQKFLSAEIPRLKAENPTMPQKEIFRLANVNWMQNKTVESNRGGR